MSITLAVGATSVALPDSLYWADEFWAPVQQSADRSITGAMIVMSALRVGGQPITLQPNGDDNAWLLASTLTQLRAWAAVPGRQMTLTLRGVAYVVIWRHQDTALEGAPLVHYTDVDGADWYLTTLRFMVVET